MSELRNRRPPQTGEDPLYQLARMAVRVASDATLRPRQPTTRVDAAIIRDIRAECDRLGVDWRVRLD